MLIGVSVSHVDHKHVSPLLASERAAALCTVVLQCADWGRETRCALQPWLSSHHSIPLPQPLKGECSHTPLEPARLSSLFCYAFVIVYVLGSRSLSLLSSSGCPGIDCRAGCLLLSP